MPDTTLTYGQLDEILRTHGFTVHTLEGRARIYKHETTEATVILPDSPFADNVLPHHLIVVRTVLHEFDLPEPVGLTLSLRLVG